MAIVIQGFGENDKYPGFVGETKFGVGAVALGSITLTLLFVGLKGSSSGDLTVDTEVRQIFDEDEADTAAQAGSELARMVYKGVENSRNLKMMVAAPTGGGGNAAALTLTVGGTWTEAGSFEISVGGDTLEVLVADDDTVDDVAASIAAKVQATPRFAASGASAAEVATLTIKSPGIRGNQYNCFRDLTAAPAGLTITLGGAGSAINGGGRTFGGGTGTEDYEALLATLFPGRYHRVVWAANDATSLADIEAHIDSKSGAQEGRMEHCIVAHGGTLSAATSVAQTTLNNWRFQLCWLENTESHPSEIASAMGAVRVAAEQTQPNSGYDDVVLKGIRPQRSRADWPTSRAEYQSALDNSVTPLRTTESGEVVVVRAITTRSLDGANPDYRTLDTAEAVVPDAVRDALALYWSTAFRPANPYVRSEPAPEEPIPTSGLAYPSLWNSAVAKLLADFERASWITQTTANPPVTEYNPTAKRLMSAVPAIPLPIQHQIGVSVRQQNAT